MKKILLFDADHEKSKKLKKLLENYKFDVAIMEDTNNAIEALIRKESDFLILDIDTLAGDDKFNPDILNIYHEDKSLPVFFIISDLLSDFSPVNYQEVIDGIVLKPYREEEVALRILNAAKNLHHILCFNGEMDRLNVLMKISSLPYKSVDLEHISENILKIISETFKNKSAALFLKDEERIRLISSYGPAADENLEKFIPVTVKITMEQKKTMFFENLCRDLLLDRSVWNNPGNLQNVISMPLISEDKVIGVLELYNAPSLLFSSSCDDEINFLHQLIDEASNVLNLSAQFSKIYSDLKFVADELTILYEISDALSSTLNLDELLKLIVRKAVKSFEAQVVSLMMIDRATGELFIRHAEGMDEEIIRNTRVKIGDGVAGRVALTGQPLLLVDVVGLEAKDLIKNVKSALSVPLKVKDKVIGVINVSKNARYHLQKAILKSCSTWQVLLRRQLKNRNFTRILRLHLKRSNLPT
jgi:transcriptional regulator with GAF, ATPase, and Fis domain